MPGATTVENAPRALVTQAGSRVGYTIMRSLAGLGVEVVCMDTAQWTPTRLSRYCRVYLQCPDPHIDPEGYLAFVDRVVTEYGIERIVPAYDEAFFLAKHRHRLTRPDVLAAQPYEQYLKLHHKPSFSAVAAGAGGRVPRCTCLRAEADLGSAARSCGFPMIVKPEYGGGGWAVEQIDSFDDLLARWRAFDRAGHDNELFAQERVTGVLCGHGLVANAGQVVAANSYASLRQYPAGTGPATCRTQPPANDMASQAARIVALTGWTGPCHFDFIVEPESGRSWAIDCNPRFWGSIDHAAAAGFDVPQTYWRTARGEHIKLDEVEGPDTLWFWGDLLDLLSHLRHERGRVRLTMDRLAAWRRVVIDDWDWRDPLPFLGQPACRLLGGSDRRGF